MAAAGRFARKTAHELPGDARLRDSLVACGSGAARLVPFPIRHGDVLFVEAADVAASSFGELVYDLFYEEKSLPVRMLWGFRGWLGRVLGWERHPRDGRFANQWRDPDAPFAVGQKLGFMQLAAIDHAGEELLLRIANRTVEAFFVIKRRRRQLYMGSIVNPLGRFGRVYWWLIQPFHKRVIAAWVANCGKTHLRRLGAAGGVRS